MTRRSLLAAASIVAIPAFIGCPPPDGEPLVLTAEQQAAINMVVEQLTAGGAILGTFRSLEDDQLDPDDITQLGFYGTCPQVAWAASATNAVIALSFFDGCTSAATAGKTVSGTAEIQLNRTTRTATISFLNLTVDGHTIAGTATLTINRLPGGGVTLTGTIDLTTDDVGTIDGSITMQISTAGVLTITTGNVTVDDGTDTYDVALDDLVIDPVNNDNFVPESGTATFEFLNTGSDPATLTIVIRFDANSPVDGTVAVTVEGAGPAEHEIPGLVD